MEYPKDLLEEQKALLLDDLKFSDGIERIQDLKRLKEVNDALLILSEVNRITKIKINEPFEIKNVGGKYMVEINNFIDKENLWEEELNFIKVD